MPRSEKDKIPSATWAIRISRTLDEVRLALKDISGVCIGEHSADDGCSRNHYHIYYPHTKETSKETFTKFFMTKYSLNLKGNKDFAITIPTSFHDWYCYVYGGHTSQTCDCGNYIARTVPTRQATEIQFNDQHRPYALQTYMSDLVTTSPSITNDVCLNAPNSKENIVVLPKKDKSHKDPAYIRFYKYIRDINYDSCPDMATLCDDWIDWTQGAYELRNVSAPIRYAMVQEAKRFNDGNIPDVIRDELRTKLLRQI